VYAGAEMNPNAIFNGSILELFRSFSRNRQLIVQMTKREVIGRYRGSMLGLAWSFFNPLIMLAVYTIVFSTVFKAKWGLGSDSKTEFALVLFVGIIVHGILAESMTNSPSLILRNISYVKKIVFPLEVLPWIVMGSTIFHALISVIVWMMFFSIVNLSLNWTVIFLPIVFTPLILFSLGVSWMLASLGVYIRDIGQMTGVLTTILLFMSPVFYPASMLPEPYRTFLYLNPLTFIIEQAREILMWGNLPDWYSLCVAYVVSLIVAWLGFLLFQKTRSGFSDVI